MKVFKKNNFTKGGIDSITPSKISGWVFDPKIKYTEVKLTQGDNLISSSLINEFREDIVNKFSIKGKPGFTLMLSGNNALEEQSNANIRIFAVNSNYDKKFELKFFRNPKTTLYTLKKILNSEVVGRDGFIDGIQSDGKIHGWAGSKNSSKSIDIWMACDYVEPIRIKCDQRRAGLDSLQIGEFSGFNIDANHRKYVRFRGKEVRFYFDKDCKFQVPQAEILNVPSNQENLNISEKTSISLNLKEKKHFYAKKISLSKGNLKDKWKFIEKYSSEIDNLELEIKAYKALKVHNQNIFNKLIYFFKKNK